MRKIFTFLLFLFCFTHLQTNRVIFAQNTPPSSQMLTMDIQKINTENYTVSSSILLTNNSSKNIAKSWLTTKLLSKGKVTTLQANNQQVTIQDPGQLIAFSKSDVFSIKPTDILTKNTSVVYPPGIASGTYTLLVELFDNSGNSQSIVSEEIKLSGTDTFLSITEQDCRIKVGEISYNIAEGPNVDKNETAVLTCPIQNNTASIITAKPHVIYTVNSVTKTTADTKQIDALQPLTIAPGQSATSSITIPKNLLPQVYEGLFSIVDFENHPISPIIPFRWISTGPSAVINELNLDKSYYKNGDTAKIHVSALPSTDLSWRGGPNMSNPGFKPDAGTDLKNPKIVIKIVNADKKLCGEQETSLPSTKKEIYWNDLAINVPINIECKNPQVQASLFEEGIQEPLAVLSEGKVTTKTDLESPTIKNATPLKNVWIWILAGVIGVLVLLGGYLLWKKRKQLPSSPSTKTIAVILIVLLSGAIYMGSGKKENKTNNYSLIAQAQQQFGPIVGTSKLPVNSSDVTTNTVDMKKAHERRVQHGPGPAPLEWANVRDFKQNNPAGDSTVEVDSTCKTIRITVNGTVGSDYMCGNWGPGIAIANFVDGKPITPTDLSSALGNKVFIPSLQVVPAAFNNFAAYGPHILNVSENGIAGPKSVTYTLPLPAGMTEGQHTLLLQAGVSQATYHGAFDRYYSSLEPIIDGEGIIPGDVNCGGKTPCFITLQRNFTCGPPACGNTCTKDDECTGAKNGCTACVPNDAGQKVCAPPPACGAGCQRDDQCAGATKDGCTACVPNDAGQKVCAPPPACNVACTRDDQCAGAKDGCTSCLPNDVGEASSCKPAPACGTSCTKDSQCAGAKNGCNICTAGKCSAFSADMCSCDGMDFVSAKGDTFFPGDDVTFIAYGVVPGKDWKGNAQAALNSATVTSITLSLYQSSLTKPNEATRLAQSTAITPEQIPGTGGKMRYKVTWNQKIPATVPSGSLFRVQADVKCSAKPGVLGAKTSTTINYYEQVMQTIQGLIVHTKTVLGDATDNQQADTFFPGAKISEKSCNIMKFYFD